MLFKGFRIFITGLLLIFTIDSWSQTSTLNGYIRDNSNGEALIGANVFIKGSATGTVTNVYGFYSLSLPNGKYQIVISYIGFDFQELEIDLSGDQSINVELTPSSSSIDEVVVTSEKKNENIVSTRMSVDKLNARTIEQIPVMFGEPDVIKSLKLLPGVNSTGETSSNLSVRGGARDQNMIYLDEATVYNASHMLGIFSVFNNDAIRSVELYKGIMPAEYGGRVSSLIDIRMKEGNSKKFTATGGIGTMLSKITLEAPIVKDKGSFMISGRRTYFDLISKAANKTNSKAQKLPYYFYDLNLKTNFAITPKHRVYLSGYFGRDVSEMIAEDDASSKFSWGNYTGTFRWNYMINKKLFSNVTFIASNYNYKMDNEFKVGKEKRTNSFIWDAFIKDYVIKTDMGYYLNPKNTLNFGASVTFHDVNVGEIHARMDTMKYHHRIPKSYCREYHLYASNLQKLTPLLSLEYGVRYSILQNIGTGTEYKLENYEVQERIDHKSGSIFNTFGGFEPRVLVNLILSEKHSIKAGYSRIYQYMHVASNSVTGTPLDVWIPSGPNVKPQLADQFSIGYFRNFFDNKLQTSLETYYKDLKNQIEFREFSEPYFNPVIEEEFRFGKGYSYGAELTIKKLSGKLTGWMTYTYSRSMRKTEDIQEEGWYPSYYDRPHDIAIVAMYTISPRVSISGNWVYQSGVPFNSPVARWIYGDLNLPYYPGKNADRLPDYHRLDFGVEIKNKPSKKFRSSWTFSVYNLYNRRNANNIYFVQDDVDFNKTIAKEISIMPIMPSVTWNFKF